MCERLKNDFAHLAALVMATIMIFHVRSKFTAVGRKEILTFFYVYVLLTSVSLVLDAGVMQASNDGPYMWFVAVPEPKTAKNRWHFDLRAPADRDTEVARLEDLGARVSRRGPDLTVMADPEGNEFCVE